MNPPWMGVVLSESPVLCAILSLVYPRVCTREDMASGSIVRMHPYTQNARIPNAFRLSDPVLATIDGFDDSTGDSFESRFIQFG